MNEMIPKTDLESERELQQEQRDAATNLLEMLGTMLNQADSTLNDLEKTTNDQYGGNTLVGQAIFRKCQEFGDAIGCLANDLETQSEEQKRALAQACAKDITNDSLLLEVTNNNEKEKSQAQELALQLPKSEEDWIGAIEGATNLLRDVQQSFLDVGKQDADEIADVALTVARLFLLSLQNLHSTVTPESIVNTAATVSNKAGDQKSSQTVYIEELNENGEANQTSNNEDNNAANQSSDSNRAPSSSQQRVRVLWPPLGPHVNQAFGWSKEKATQKPLLAVALGLTMWPAAIATAILGTSLVVVDGALQNAYTNYQETSLIKAVEQGTVQVYQTGKLVWICSKFAGRQTMRVAKRQIDRQGGIGNVANNIKDVAIDRALNPIETANMAWKGVSCGVGWVSSTVSQLLEQRKEMQQQRQATTI